jgi:pSer/pThr/pTyr-binding forkhead associated (FHA) protein
MKCPKCGHENPPNEYICTKCEEPLDVTVEDLREKSAGALADADTQEIRIEEAPNLFYLVSPFLKAPVKLDTSRSYTIGRDGKNHVVLPSNKISRLHAEVYWHKGAFWIEDQRSRNGTYVNGKRITREQLKDRDEIDISRYMITFRAFKNKKELKAELEKAGAGIQESTQIMPIAEGKISGVIGEIPIGELLGLLVKNSKTGVFKVWTENQEAEIDLLEGEVIHAEVGSSVIGEMAFEHILGLEEGRFHFEQCVVTCPQTISIPTGELMKKVLDRLKKAKKAKKAKKEKSS